MVENAGFLAGSGIPVGIFDIFDQANVAEILLSFNKLGYEHCSMRSLMIAKP